MKVGNVNYIKTSDLPENLAVFPMPSVLVLPGFCLSLNVFEPRYLALVEDALKGNHLLGTIQMLPGESETNPKLYQTGCITRIVGLNEIGDGRLAISLQGICRFLCLNEIEQTKPYRIFKIAPNSADLAPLTAHDEQFRETLLNAFSNYLEANNLDADWERIMQASSETLVNSLAISAPFTAAERQALLEAPDLAARAEILIALAERSILAQDGVNAIDLQ